MAINFHAFILCRNQLKFLRKYKYNNTTWYGGSYLKINKIFVMEEASSLCAPRTLNPFRDKDDDLPGHKKPK